MQLIGVWPISRNVSGFFEFEVITAIRPLAVYTKERRHSPLPVIYVFAFINDLDAVHLLSCVQITTVISSLVLET